MALENVAAFNYLDGVGSVYVLINVMSGVF